MDEKIKIKNKKEEEESNAMWLDLFYDVFFLVTVSQLFLYCMILSLSNFYIVMS
jgi:hypothetical protein